MLIQQAYPIHFNGINRDNKKVNEDKSMPTMTKKAVAWLKSHKDEIYENGQFSPIAIYYDIEGTDNKARIVIAPDPEFPKTKRMIKTGALKKGYENKICESFYKTDLTTKQINEWFDNADIDDITAQIYRNSNSIDKVIKR